MRRRTLGTVAEMVVVGLMVLTAACDPCSSCGEHHGKPHVLIATGTVDGGTSPISGSQIVVLKAGTSPAQSAKILGTATSASDGTFQVYGYKAPAPTDFLYVLALGGDAGGGSNNAIALETVYGPASTIPISVTINELTTVASAYAFTQFFDPVNEFNLRDSTHPELALAMYSYLNMIDPATGALGPAFTGTLNQPYQINLIADALATCVQLSSANACPILLNAANIPSASGDTLGAAINMNRAPAHNYTGIYGIAIAGSQPYLPISKSPADLAMTLSFSGGGAINPIAVAIDASGDLWFAGRGGYVNAVDPSGAPLLSQPVALGCAGGGIAVDPSGKIWVSTCSSVARIDPSVSPPEVITASGGGFNGPEGLAADTSGHIWVANYTGSSVTELDSNADPVGTQPITGGGINGPTNVAIDSNGNVWISNYDASTISELDSAGTPVAASPYSDPSQNLNQPLDIAIDPSDNAWVTDFAGYEGNSITKLDISGASPVFSTFVDNSLYAPNYLAADGTGNIWVSNFYGGAIDEFGNSGTLLSESGGYTGALDPFVLPSAVAIDSAGNVWVANGVGQGTRSGPGQAVLPVLPELVEIVGAATPIVTPLNSAPVRP